jgi:hypothetical protein
MGSTAGDRAAQARVALLPHPIEHPLPKLLVALRFIRLTLDS